MSSDKMFSSSGYESLSLMRSMTPYKSKLKKRYRPDFSREKIWSFVISWSLYDISICNVVQTFLLLKIIWGGIILIWVARNVFEDEYLEEPTTLFCKLMTQNRKTPLLGGSES